MLPPVCYTPLLSQCNYVKFLFEFLILAARYPPYLVELCKGSSSSIFIIRAKTRPIYGLIAFAISWGCEFQRPLDPHQESERVVIEGLGNIYWGMWYGHMNSSQPRRGHREKGLIAIRPCGVNWTSTRGTRARTSCPFVPDLIGHFILKLTLQR